VGRAAVVSVPEVAREKSGCLAPPLELVERIGIRTWIARAAVAPVVARWLGEPTEFRSLALPKVLGRQAALPFLIPVLGTLERDGAIWLVSELDAGVSLRRLLQVVKLAPLQAGVLAADVIEAVEAMHAAGHAHGRLHPGNVQIGLGGEVRLTDWAVGVLTNPGPGRGPKPADRRAVAALVAQLTGNEPAAKDGRGSDADPEAALGAPEAQAVARVGLAALVASEARNRPPIPPLRDMLPTVVHVPDRTPVQHQWRRRLVRGLRAAGAPVGRAGVTLALLATVVGAEFVLFGDRMASNVELLRGRPTAPTGMASPPSAPKRVPRSPLPLSAGPVAAVELRALDPCRPGDRCTLIVDVRVQPHGAPLRLSWRFRVVDDCTGSQVSLSGSTGSLRPGVDRIVRLHSVALPAGRALEVVAATSEPAAVASRALHLPGDPVTQGVPSC
jgi:hypothetical protein